MAREDRAQRGAAAGRAVIGLALADLPEAEIPVKLYRRDIAGFDLQKQGLNAAAASVGRCVAKSAAPTPFCRALGATAMVKISA